MNSAQVQIWARRRGKGIRSGRTSKDGQRILLHGEGCRRSSSFRDRFVSHHGYFENRQGEQAVFVFDFETGTARLALGDAGWELWHPVVDGKPEGVIVSAEEAAWLKACWLAVKSRGGKGKLNS